jgi:hypothetical protein
LATAAQTDPGSLTSATHPEEDIKDEEEVLEADGHPVTLVVFVHGRHLPSTALDRRGTKLQLAVLNLKYLTVIITVSRVENRVENLKQ